VARKFNTVLAILLLISSCVHGGNAAQAAAPNDYRFIPLGEVNDEAAERIVIELGLLNMLPVNERPNAIFIEIDSPGGSVDSGKDIIKAIEASNIEVVCRVGSNATAASMGFMILEACPVRVMSSSALLMWHTVSLSGGRINAKNMDELVGIINAMNHASANFVSRRMTLSAQEVFEKMQKGDWWMASDEALAIGAVDFVIP